MKEKQRKAKKTRVYHMDEENRSQIDILRKYYPYDEGRNVFTIRLYHEKASEILNADVSEFGRPQFQEEEYLRIAGILDDFPRGIPVEVNFCIDDYEGYNPEDFAESFIDGLRLYRRRSKRGKKNRNWLAVVLFFAGMLLTMFSVFLAASGFGTGKLGFEEEVFAELLATASSLFVWEALTVVFLTPVEAKSIITKIMLCVSKIRFCDGKDNEKFIEAEVKDVIKSLVRSHQSESNAQHTILIAGVACLVLGLQFLFSGLSILLSNAGSNWPAIDVVLFSEAMLCSIIMTVASSFSARIYSGKIHSRLAPVVCGGLGVITVTCLIVATFFANTPFLTGFAFLSLISISTFLVGAIWRLAAKRRLGKLGK